jgi:predicted dehydrogenase
MTRPRVLVAGVSHWHTPLYLDALRRNFALVGMTDPQPERVQALATALDVPTGSDTMTLVDAVRPDLVVVLGRHDTMATVAEDLIDRRIPFLIEKPGGVGLRQVERLRGRARAAGVPVVVPFVHRWGPLASSLARVGRPQRFSASYLVGPPSRYVETGNDWMLDSAAAGGGALTNLGVHFVDLFLQLTGSPIDEVRGLTSSAMHGFPVEDHATILVRTRDGAIGSIEVGYGFPSSPAKRSARFSASSPDGFVAIDGDGRATVTHPDGSTETDVLDIDSDPLFGAFVDRMAASLPSGFAGLPGLDDLVSSMTVIARAYADAAGVDYQKGGTTWAN